MNTLIETWNSWSAGWPGWAWPMFWQSSLLIAALWVFDLALRRKVRADVRYALWLVVVLKLIVPPTLALPTGLAWWLRSSPAPQRIAQAGKIVVTYPDALVEMPVPPAAPIEVLPAPHLPAVSWLLAVSTLISLALLGWLLVRWLQVARDIRRATDASATLHQLLQEARSLVGLRASVRLRLTQRKMSPAVCGLVRPVILLPETLAGKLSEPQLRAVLVHELMHVKRGDVWVNCLQTLVQIVCWWHPLVWLANARIRQVREEAVDDAVMLALRDEADGYAPTLLEVAKLAFRRPLASLGLVGILESRSALRQRIERLLDFQMPKRTGLSFASVLGILAFTTVAVPMGERPPPRVAGIQLAQVASVSVPVSGTVSSETHLEPVERLIAEGRLLLMAGKLDEANLKIQEAVRMEPTNSLAGYYQGIVQIARSKRTTTNSPTGISGTESNYIASRAVLPVLNPLARTNLIHTNPARQAIVKKLDQIRFDTVTYNGVPLSEVARQLSKETKLRAADGRGINFMVNLSQPAQAAGNTNAAADLRVESAQTNLVPVITINPPLTNALLRDVLDAVVKSSDTPIKYSIKDNWIEFSLKGNEALPLSSRRFKVDANALVKKIEGVTGRDFAAVAGTLGVTDTNRMSRIQSAVIAWCRTLGVNLDPPKSVFFNEREGTLWIRASTEDLGTIEAAIKGFSVVEPQVNIGVKFIELPKELADALPVDWSSSAFSETNGNARSMALLTPSQERELLHILQNKKGVEEISDGQVTTLSGRQAQLQAVDFLSTKALMEHLHTNHLALPDTLPISLPIGPTLDLIPYVSADGFAIQLTVIPTFVDFLGYDDPGQFVIQAQQNANVPVTSVLPLPRFRLRSVEPASVLVRDGHTFAIRIDSIHQPALPKETTPPTKRSDLRRQTIILVTPTLLDPAGNRIHTDAELNSRPAMKR